MKFAIALIAIMVSPNVFGANSKCSEGLATIRAEIAGLNQETERIEKAFDTGFYVRQEAVSALIELSKKRIELREERMALLASNVCR